MNSPIHGDGIPGPIFQPRRRWSCLGDLAAAVAAALEEGETTWAWRMCTEVFDDENAGTTEGTELFVSHYPTLTGNSWADAMVAALGEWVCLQRGVKMPPWTLETRIAAPFWFVNRLFATASLHETPLSFSSRGIFLTRRDLVAA